MLTPAQQHRVQKCLALMTERDRPTTTLERKMDLHDELLRLFCLMDESEIDHLLEIQEDQKR